MNKKLPFGVMFHHFYDQNHPKGQGALSLDNLNYAIKRISSKYYINSPEEFIYKYENQKLSENDTCLTFDDGLRCQYDIAAPLLEDFKLKAFFFIYSKPFFGSPVLLESHRYFRSIAFSNVEIFYKEFFNFLKQRYQIDVTLINNKIPKNYYPFNFYTTNDIIFRYLRDYIFNENEFDLYMRNFANSIGYSLDNTLANIWMNNEMLVSLKNTGHKIGLHSFSHPTVIDSLPIELISKEYHANKEHLSSLLGENAVSMSHPCGKYNNNILKILMDMGIKIGFRSNMNLDKINSAYEIPRIDSNTFLYTLK